MIQEFLINDHKEDGRWDSVKIIAKILLMVLEVHQYTNGNDCGNDVVHIDFTLFNVFPKQEVRQDVFHLRKWYEYVEREVGYINAMMLVISH